MGKEAMQAGRAGHGERDSRLGKRDDERKKALTKALTPALPTEGGGRTSKKGAGDACKDAPRKRAEGKGGSTES